MACQLKSRLTGGLSLLAVAAAMLLAGASHAAGEEAEHNAEERKVKVFIFAGQSNMVGRSDPKLLPEAYRQPLANVRLYADGAWRELGGPLRSRQDGIGPEVSAARLLSETFADEQIVLVKTAVGGTNLHTQWNPQRKDSLYARMLKDVRTATAGRDAEIVAMFWAQGGGDSKTEAGAAAYGKNLAAFIAQARKDFGRAELPFIFSATMWDPQVPPVRPGRYPYMAAVEKGKTEVAKTVAHTATVSTAGLTRIPNDGHYDTAGTIEFGRRFFEAWKNEFHKPATDAPAVPARP